MVLFLVFTSGSAAERRDAHAPFLLSWPLALLCSFALTLVPLAGRFAYLGLAIIGAYYVIDAGFSFSGAVGHFID